MIFQTFHFPFSILSNLPPLFLSKFQRCTQTLFFVSPPLYFPLFSYPLSFLLLNIQTLDLILPFFPRSFLILLTVHSLSLLFLSSSLSPSCYFLPQFFTFLSPSLSPPLPSLHDHVFSFFMYPPLFSSFRLVPLLFPYFHPQD
jgi:hypothetical protein